MPIQLPSICQDWLTDLDRRGKHPATIQSYRQSLHHFLRWYHALYHDDFLPQRVRPRDVRDWQTAQQRDERAAPATINRRLVALNRFFQWAVARRLLLENPADEIRAIRLPQRQVKSLQHTLLRRLLHAAKDHPRDYAIIEILATTGVRVSELLQLRLGDLVLKERSGILTVRAGKGGGYREIPLTLDVRKALQAYLHSSHPAPTNPLAPLWISTDGSLTHRSSVSRLLEKYALRADLGTITPHMLRHTFASRYLAANPDDLRGLAHLLGHASLDTVMFYTEPTLSELAQRMEQVEAHLEPGLNEADAHDER